LAESARFESLNRCDGMTGPMRQKYSVSQKIPP